MAHELDIDSKTGKHTMFSVINTPWHKLGNILTKAPTLEEAIRLAGHDYEVATKEVYYYHAEDMDYKPLKKSRISYRTDTGKIFGVVGHKYTALQMVDAVQIFKPLIDKGVVELQTGGTLRKGEDAWMLVKYNIKDPVVQEVFTDKTIPFGLLANNHSGKKAVTLKHTPIEVVCANTLSMAYRHGGDSISVRHRGDARLRLIEAAEQMFAKITDRYKAIAEDYKLMKETIISVETFTKLILNEICPIPIKNVDTAIHKRDMISYRWENGLGITGNHSAWEAYMAVTEMADHSNILYSARKKGNKLESMYDGRLAKIKNSVLDNLVSYCRKEK